LDPCTKIHDPRAHPKKTPKNKDEQQTKKEECTSTDTQTKGRVHKPSTAAVANRDKAGPMSMHEKHTLKDNDKRTTTIKQRQNSQAPTQKREKENITDQEELLLLAKTELVQGGEEQLWELFLPLSSLLPVLLELLQQHSHLAS